MQSAKKQKIVSVIIPAHNEEHTIKNIIRTASSHPIVKEVIAVDDGSCDNTLKEISGEKAKAVILEKNMGKANAMEMGSKEASGEIICFLDADLLGVTHEAISEITDPVVCGKYGMFTGVLERKSVLANRLLPFLPKLSGNRAIKKTIWEKIPARYKKGYQIEVAMNYFAPRLGYDHGSRIIKGVKQRIKEKKHGFALGFLERLSMMFEVALIFIRLYIIKNITDHKNK